MNSEENDELWQLLGRARQERVSPFFSRDVLRLLREDAAARPSFLQRLRYFARRRYWAAATAGAATLALVTFGIVQQPAEPDPVVLLAHQVSASPDYQVISHLDELLDSEHNSAWLDTSAY